jgi:hypothetical protein
MRKLPSPLVPVSDKTNYFNDLRYTGAEKPSFTDFLGAPPIRFAFLDT